MGREYALAVAADTTGLTRPTPAGRHLEVAAEERTVIIGIRVCGQVIRHLLRYPS
jgi:hypothetical protein